MWKDVTKLVEFATQDFDIGQLLSSNRFSLYDAINAIEVMNPRMDTGLFREIASFEVYKKLSLLDTVDVMDNLVVREMAWISGHSISQTVFTCVYFHHMTELNQLSLEILNSRRTEDIVFSALRIYLLATLKCCHYVWSEMSQRNLYDGEDFTTHLFGLSFNQQLPDMSILNDLDNSIVHLKEIEASPILYRVEMRRSFLLGLMHMSRNKATHLLQSKNELIRILQLVGQLSFTDNRVKDVFDVNISRKLSAHTPPRPAKLDTKIEAYQKYQTMIYQLTSLCDILNNTSVISLMNFYKAFGSLAQADAFSRSRLISTLFADKRVLGTHTSRLIPRHMQETLAVPDAWLSPTNQIQCANPKLFLESHEALKLFLEIIANSFLETFRIHGHNRPRQRRRLKKMMYKWHMIETRAIKVDKLFQQAIGGPTYFSNWSLWMKQEIMENVLLLGFELDLYSPHEYEMTLWYHVYLLQDRLRLLQEIRGHSASSYIESQVCWTLGRLLLVESTVWIIRWIQSTGQLQLHKPLMDDEKTRYWQRFKCFAKVAPLPPYEVYLKDRQKQMYDVRLLSYNLTKAKEFFVRLYQTPNEEQKTELCSEYTKLNIEKMMLTCERNLESLSSIQEGLPLILEFIHHACPAIQKKKK